MTKIERICSICGTWSEPYALNDITRPIILHSSIYRCLKCGLLICNPRHTKIELDAFYQNYWQREHPEYLAEKYDSDPLWVSYSTLISSKLRSGRVIDLGCGTGGFLKLFKGFELHGIEPDPVAVEHCRAIGISSVVCGDIEGADLGDCIYDVVVLWHVIEHLLDFMQVLNCIYRCLKPKGYIIIGTENYDNRNVRLRRYCSFLRFKIPEITTATEHTFLFHPKSLRGALQKSRFDIDHIQTYRLIDGKYHRSADGDLMAAMARKK